MSPFHFQPQVIYETINDKNKTIQVIYETINEDTNNRKVLSPLLPSLLHPPKLTNKNRSNYPTSNTFPNTAFTGSSLRMEGHQSPYDNMYLPEKHSDDERLKVTQVHVTVQENEIVQWEKGSTKNLVKCFYEVPDIED